MKFVLGLIFIACFVIDDDIFVTNVELTFGAPGVELSASIDINSGKENGHEPHGKNEYPVFHTPGKKYCGDDNPRKKGCFARIGGHCGNHVLCCLGYCDGTETCACIPNTVACDCDEECCKGKCIKSQCFCGAKGDACLVSTDCCVGICRNGRCGTCVADFSNQETCKEDSDCCKGRCNDDTKHCECGTSGGPCTSPRDCCGGTCNRIGACECLSYNNATCDPKMPDSCCFGTCGRGITGEFRCIGSPQNAVCDAVKDCENLVCKKNRCSCNVVGEACEVGLQQCCQGLNCNGGTSQCQK